MPRYGRDYGRAQGAAGRYGQDWERDQAGSGRGYGGMRSDGWDSSWQDFAGEGGWYGEGMEGYPTGGYLGGTQGGYGGEYGRGMRSGHGAYDRETGMWGGGYGGGYGGRETGYGGFDRSERNLGGRRGSSRVGSGPGRNASVRASEIMTENPAAVTPDTSLADVAKRMKEMNVGIIPVVEDMENRRLRGVITDRDIAIRAVAEGKDGRTKVSDCMTDDVETVNKNDPIDQVLQVMQRDQVRRVPVTDREGRLVGIIAQADLAVDYADPGARSGRRVERTIERISQPAKPQRNAMQAQGRSRQGGSQGSQGGNQ
jgi:CBS domain-containing protein